MGGVGGHTTQLSHTSQCRLVQTSVNRESWVKSGNNSCGVSSAQYIKMCGNKIHKRLDLTSRTVASSCRKFITRFRSLRVEK